MSAPLLAIMALATLLAACDSGVSTPTAEPAAAAGPDLPATAARAAVTPSPTSVQASLSVQADQAQRPPPRPAQAVSKLAMRWSQGACAENGPESFDASPMYLEDIGAMVPMGLMVGAHVTPIDHIYFSPAVFRSEPYRYEVMAPADGHIVAVQMRTRSVEGEQSALEVPEYRIVIEYSCSLYTIYDLVTRLAPSVDAQLGTLRPGETQTRIPVASGEVIGRIGGQTLDMNGVDIRVTLPGFIDPGHYEREPWKIHSVDPFDYFQEPLRSHLLVLNPRTAEPRGGKIDYDVPGRLVGNWFAAGTNGYAGSNPSRYWEGHLSIVYDLYDPSQVRVSVRNFGGRSAQFGVRGNTPDPADVEVATGLVRYELVDWTYYVADSGERWDRFSPAGGIVVRNTDHVGGILLAQMLEDGSLSAEVFLGNAALAQEGFTSSATIFER